MEGGCCLVVWFVVVGGASKVICVLRVCSHVRVFGLGLVWSWSRLVLVPFGLGLVWSWSRLVLVSFGLGLVWSWSRLVLVPFGLGLVWSWSRLVLVPIGLGLVWSWTRLVLVSFGLGPLHCLDSSALLSYGACLSMLRCLLLPLDRLSLFGLPGCVSLWTGWISLDWLSLFGLVVLLFALLRFTLHVFFYRFRICLLVRL